MWFCQVWIVGKAITYNLAKPQTFPLEKPRSSNSGLRCCLVFWMNLYKVYRQEGLWTEKISAISESLKKESHPNEEAETEKLALGQWLKEQQLVRTVTKICVFN